MWTCNSLLEITETLLLFQPDNIPCLSQILISKEYYAPTILDSRTLRCNNPHPTKLIFHSTFVTAWAVKTSYGYCNSYPSYYVSKWYAACSPRVIYSSVSGQVGTPTVATCWYTKEVQDWRKDYYITVKSCRPWVWHLLNFMYPTHEASLTEET